MYLPSVKSKDVVDFKKAVLDELHFVLDQRTESIKEQLISLKEARDLETKSSSGDKHETSRARIQSEIDQNELQYGNLLKLKSEINQLNIEKMPVTAEAGSLVETNEGLYFISIGFGRIQVSNKDVLTVSAASPIGQFLIGKGPGENALFLGRKINIKKLS